MPLVDTEVFERAQSLMQAWRLEEATRVLEKARDRGFRPPRMHHELSVLYAQQGLFGAALAEIEMAMALEPTHRANWHHFLALQKNNPSQPAPAAWRAMHLAYGDTLRERFDARHLSVTRERSGARRLKVGYLCLDTHLATGRFTWPVLEHFDAAAFEVFAYWCHSAVSPAHEARYPKVAHRSILGLDEDEIVARVLADRIDVLVDIAGHGAGNALPSLAQRPAPVQLTWLDYLATTGLETVDFRITDELADPPGAASAHVESLARLPVSAWCYRPHWDLPVPQRAARNSRAVVFGSACVPLKLSDPLLETWAQLLSRVEGSRLRLLGIPEGRARERIVARFAAARVDTKRLEILPRLEQPVFFDALGEVDLVLDSFPFSGATSTLDALWQGAPVVTMSGTLAHGRSSASILATLGRAHWIAATRCRYVEIAAQLAADEAQRIAQHASLRHDLQRSALCDGVGFAREMERIYREKWIEWIAASAAAAPSARPTARADALLGVASPEPPAAEALSPTCRGLLDVLPSHPATSALFWREVGARAQRTDANPGAMRARLAEHADIVLFTGDAGFEKRIAEGGAPWLLITMPGHYIAETLEGSIPRDLLERSDVIAPFGVDRLVNGSLASAGRGHASGVAMLADGDDRFLVSAWVPRGMGGCVALSGSCVLVRRALLGRAQFPWRATPSESGFRLGIAAWSHELFRGGARLGVGCALAMAARAAPTDLAAEYAGERELERRFALERWSQTGVAASPVKAAMSRAMWRKMLPTLESICDV